MTCSSIISFPNSFLNARISPKENSRANGKFLPKPLLFHLRLPNPKTNEPKFWQILSPKNSFANSAAGGKSFEKIDSAILAPAKSLRFLNSDNVSFGGPERTRTAYLLLAKQAFYQLNYGPISRDTTTLINFSSANTAKLQRSGGP